MARQLSEQLEREVSADELLKSQTKTGLGENLPNSVPRSTLRIRLPLRRRRVPFCRRSMRRPKHRRRGRGRTRVWMGCGLDHGRRHACVGSAGQRACAEYQTIHE